MQPLDLNTPQIHAAIWAGIAQAVKIAWPLLPLLAAALAARIAINRWERRREDERTVRNHVRALEQFHRQPPPH
jgi:hypothetical protein